MLSVDKVIYQSADNLLSCVCFVLCFAALLLDLNEASTIIQPQWGRNSASVKTLHQLTSASAVRLYFHQNDWRTDTV